MPDIWHQPRINGIRAELGIRQTYVVSAQYDVEAGVTPHDDHFDAVILPYQDSRPSFATSRQLR